MCGTQDTAHSTTPHSTQHTAHTAHILSLPFNVPQAGETLSKYEGDWDHDAEQER